MGKLVSYFRITNDDIIKFNSDLIRTIDYSDDDPWKTARGLINSNKEQLHEAMKETMFNHIERLIQILVNTTYNKVEARSCCYNIECMLRPVIYKFLDKNRYSFKHCVVVNAALNEINRVGNLGMKDYAFILDEIIQPITKSIAEGWVIFENTIL